ncbi:uncharacterized protein SCHCODRAFT_02541235 [Schizophyllum commune H4-8]
MAAAVSTSTGKKYGGIPGIPPGTIFPNRKALRASGVHAEVRAGIFAEKYRDGAYAVLLNGGYPDQDHGELIEYVGQGGLDKPGGTQVASQKWDWRNRSLQQSYESRKPVRVVRGYKLDSPYAPEQGFRYDGLYRVIRHIVFTFSSILISVTGLRPKKPAKLARMRREYADQPPLPPPRSPTKAPANIHVFAGGSSQLTANGSSHARAGAGDRTHLESNAGERIAGALIEDEGKSSSRTEGEEDDQRVDDENDSSAMSIEEDECARHSHSVTSPLVARSRMRPTPVASDGVEAEEELEIREILRTSVDEEQDTESSTGKESVRRLCAAMLEAATASELASKTTLSSALLADAREAEETSTDASEEPTGGADETAVKVDEPAREADERQSPSSPPAIDNDLTIAMAELKDFAALFDAAMQRLRDAERAASHSGAPTSSRATPSTASTTRSDFEDTLGDAVAAAASAADLASLAIRRRA